MRSLHGTGVYDTRPPMGSTLRWLQGAKVFSDIPLKHLRELAEVSTVRAVDAGEVFINAGAPVEHVVFVAMGSVALYRRNKKRGVTLQLGLLEAPSIFGDAESSIGVPWMQSARAEVGSTCIFIPAQAFWRVVQVAPEFAANMYRDASRRHALANHTAMTMALYDIETRLLRYLLDYAKRLGTIQDDRAHVPQNVTQVRMAEALGVSTKTISRALGPLQERGVLAIQDQGIVVFDVETLRNSLPSNLLGLSSSVSDTLRTLR